MTKWALLTVFLYISLVVVLFVPAALWTVDIIAGENNSISEFYDIDTWPLWLLIYEVVILIQALLLVFPVDKYKARPRPQRTIAVPIITIAFLFSLLFFGITASIAAAIWGDDMDGLLPGIFWILTSIVGGWGIWAFIFYRFAHTDNCDTFLTRLMRWLVRGSIVELLVAIPCHIIVRHKNECCAQGLTFFGIAAGLVIMAFAFGPGVFFLFLKRFRKLQPKIAPKAI